MVKVAMERGMQSVGILAKQKLSPAASNPPASRMFPSVNKFLFTIIFMQQKFPLTQNVCD